MRVKLWRKKLFVSTVSLTVFLMLVVSLIPAATLVYAETNENQFSVKVDFEEPTHRTVQVQGNNYDMIQLGDCSYLSEIGKPMLPVRGALILLPPKMDVESVNLAPVEFENLPGQFDVYPAQSPTTDHKSPSFVEHDRTAYASAAPYPNKWYDKEMILSFRGYQLLYLRLYPVQYVGTNRQIRFCREMEITVTVSPTEIMTERFKFHEMGLRNSPPEIDEWISEYVLNPEMIVQYEAAVSPRSEQSPPPVVDYLIVTRDMFLDVLTTYPNSTNVGSSLFIRSKKFAGLQVAVETLEDIRTEYVGYDDADEIRQCIQDYYTTYGITYVLLLGDVENSTAEWYVPVRSMYNPDGASTWTPSDFYYAGLDGTWDADGDHRYGEREAISTEDEADWNPDVYVGRITAKTAGELETQLNKIANFKGFSDSSITNMVMCGAIMDTDEKPLKEYVRDNFIPSSVTVSELYESVGTLTESDFTEVVNSKRPEVINTASHGWYTSLSPGYFTTSTTPDLMKGPLYLWYACACLAGAFDYSSDCCGEAMMKDPDGGGMFIGASRETWFWTAYPAHINGLWGKQDWLFWQHFFEYKMYDPGSCLYNSKATYVAGCPDLQLEYERKNLFAMNLLGDPQVRATCAKRAKILFDESHDADWWIEKGEQHYDLAVALRSVGYTVDSLQVYYGPSATIDFDDLANLETIETHYLGLNFSSGYTAWDSTGNLYYPPHSTPNVAYTWETSNYIIFDVPVQSVGAYFCSPDNYNITWLAYDRADNLLDSVSIPADAENVYRSLFDQQGRIRKLVTTGTVSGWNQRWSIDDLNYTSNVYIQTMWNYDTLVLPPGQYQGYYSSLEVNYTTNFVTTGGGLCIMGEHKDWMVASNLNLISSHYGVTFQENVFHDPTNYDVATSYALAHTFPAASDSTYGILVKGLNTVLYPSGCSLSLSSPATEVATGDDDSYTTGSYESLMAAATSGDGRVFCVGDANIWDKQDFPGNGAMHLYQQDNLYLMYNVFDWLTGTRATRSVRILIDQKHGSYWSVYHGDTSSYSGLCDYLRHDNYGVYILQTSPITYSTLADYDIFVLPLPTSFFSTSEINAIKQFVNEGGHLWIIGDCVGFGTDPNQVSSEFDIEFDMNTVTDPTDYQVMASWVLYYSRNFVHQTTNCLTKLESYASASLTLSGSASSAISTDSDASPVASSVMAVSTYGDGKVVVIGDSDYFSNDDVETDGICSVDEADNARLALRIVSWAPCLESYQFPSATSTISLAHSPYVWVSGDYAEENFTWSRSLPAIQIIIHFEVTSTLSEDGYIPMDVMIDGTKVGEFIIMRGHDCIDKTFSLIANPINQGNFTIKCLVTRTVDAGKGSVQINTTGSYIRLVGAYGCDRFNFDFGTEDSPVETGYVQVIPSTSYSSSLGYGWTATSSLWSRDRLLPDDIRRDFVFSSMNKTFKVDLPNGAYLVMVIVGDQSYMHDNVCIYAEDVLEATVSTEAGEFVQKVFEVSISDDALDLMFQDDGGSDSNWVINSILIKPYYDKKFDFGTGSSPVESGYTQVLTSTSYSESTGYGWADTVDLDSRDRGAPDSLRRDFVFSSSNRTFNIDLPNGKYSVVLIIGDNSYSHDYIHVYCEGILVANDLCVEKGYFAEVAFLAEVSDGQLEIMFCDDGGTNAHWVVNSIHAKTTFDLRLEFDFGTSSSPIEDGYVRVTPATTYLPSTSYGWSDITDLWSRDRGAPDALRRDLVFSSSDRTFNVDIPNGQYQVTLIVGDQNYMHDKIDIYAEGVMVADDLNVSAGTFTEITFTVTVSDGQLNVTFHDDGGADANWVINALTIDSFYNS